jgi:predicted SprT family Zn-dependent metalloprotease
LPDGIKHIRCEPQQNAIQRDIMVEEEDSDEDAKHKNKLEPVVRAPTSTKRLNKRVITDDSDEDLTTPVKPKFTAKSPEPVDEDDDIFNVKLLDFSNKPKPKAKASQIIIDSDSDDSEHDVEEELNSSHSEHEYSFDEDVNSGSDIEDEKENILQPAPTPQKPSALSGKEFVKQRDKLMLDFYNEINRRIFQNKLPEMVVLSEAEVKGQPVRRPYLAWNKYLRTTAGITRCCVKQPSMEYIAAIELSTKVIDNVERMRKTLAHEICHVAAFLLNHVRGHGKTFFFYGDMITRVFKDLGTMTTCHAYDIHYKFVYQCVKCKQQIKRQSKSINVEKQICGVVNCGGRFELLKQQKSKDGTTQLVTPKAPSKYNVFMKENYAKIKSLNPGLTQKEIMGKVGQAYKQSQNK